MNSSASSPATPLAEPAVPTVAQREVRLTTYLIAGALLLGVVLQTWIPPGGLTLVAGALLAGVVVVAVGTFAPGRLRETIAGFRFIATLLFVLAVMAVLGTLILQRKPAAFYTIRLGALAKFILLFRLDDIFHGLPFALVMALFGASVISSATLRWPVKLRNAGFFICHVGLLTSLAGAAASATLAIRGRIDLHTGGETATHVRVMSAGVPTGERAELGFDLRLNQFDLVNYEPEYRIGYYETTEVADPRGTHQEWRLKASFDPDRSKHRLPSGDSFRLTGVYPDFRPVPDPATKEIRYGTASQEWLNPAASIEVMQNGARNEALMVAGDRSPVFLSPTRALVFERRDKEVKAYVSHISAIQGGNEIRREISVNDPFNLNGWTIYQVNYNPDDPTYSGLDAVYDPGVFWVFTGFALLSLGVFYMFYVEPRLKRRNPAAAKA